MENGFEDGRRPFESVRDGPHRRDDEVRDEPIEWPQGSENAARFAHEQECAERASRALAEALDGSRPSERVARSQPRDAFARRARDEAVRRLWTKPQKTPGGRLGGFGD